VFWGEEGGRGEGRIMYVCTVHCYNIYWPPLVANADGILFYFLRNYPPNKTQYLNGLTEKLVTSK